MKNTHTPGPWKVERPYRESGVYVTGPNTGLICNLYEPDKCLFNKDKLVSADGNARLIAAAPELIEACKAIADLAKYADGAFNPDIIKICNTAIAKAEAL